MVYGATCGRGGGRRETEHDLCRSTRGAEEGGRKQKERKPAGREQRRREEVPLFCEGLEEEKKDEEHDVRSEEVGWRSTTLGAKQNSKKKDSR